MQDGAAAPIVCPVCGLRLGYRGSDGLVVVDRRDAPLVLVREGQIRCRRRGCLGVVAVDRAARLSVLAELAIATA
jgi:transposase